MKKLLLLLSVLLALTAAPPVRAVIVYGGTGTQNTTDPFGVGANSPWNYVGTVNGDSGVYLGDYGGDYWVLTADHVGAGNFTLGATTYTAVAGSAVRVLNSDSSVTDLTLFRISTDPGLANLTLASADPVTGSSVYMIGYGTNRATAENYWSVNTGTNPYTWTDLGSSSAGANAAGYLWGSGNTKRWGTNTIQGLTSYNIGYGNTTSLYTTFSQTANSAQGANHDSGGAMFYDNGGTWELLGTIDAIASISGQPANTAVFGDQTDSVDIPTYYNSIESAIPEPADFAVWLGASLGLFAFVRRRSRR